MFWISKKKVFWKDLWKEGFVDIHNHLLWGIDDGSKSMEDSLMLLRKFSELGYKKVITTPHVMSDFYKNIRELNELLCKQQPPKIILRARVI